MLSSSLAHAWGDLRFAFRNLRKSPGFTLVAVFTLAIGIGGNTAIFSVVSGLLLNPLPYEDSERLVQINEEPRPGVYWRSSGGTFLEWQENNEHFEVMAIRRDISRSLSGYGDPRVIHGWEVTPEFLTVLGLRPLLGRDFREEDDQAGGNHDVVILSHRFWEHTLGGDPGIIGTFVKLSGKGYEVIGVLESESLMNPEIEFLTPSRILTNERSQSRDFRFVGETWARLKPGASVDAASAHLEAVKERNIDLYPVRKKEWGVSVGRVQDRMFQGARRSLNLLLWSVGAVLLIACVNVANLLLARMTSRSGELALRLALGASKSRIVCQIMTECLFLSLLGGVVGIVLGSLTIDPLVRYVGVEGIQRIEIGLDGQVLAFALGASILTGLLFGILPALKATGSDSGKFLKDGARSGTSGGRKRVQSILIVAETGLTVVLLVVAGLLIRSFFNASNEDVGFDREGALTFRLNPAGDFGKSVEKRIHYSDRILEELSRIPGVSASGFISQMPMNGTKYHGEAIYRTDRKDEEEGVDAGFDAISPGYFDAIGISILRGRNLTDADNRVDAPKVMVISDRTAKRLFTEDEDPLGRLIDFKGAAYEVVGITSDIRRYSLDLEPPLQVYLPLARFPWRTYYIVRSSVPPLSLVPLVREAVQSINAEQPIYDIETLDVLTDQTLSYRSVLLTLLSLFALVATLLACVGVYGVMAYTMSQRTREMGIRLALGATERSVVRSVLVDGLRLIAVGLILGAVGAGFASRLLQRYLYDVGRFDPVTFFAVSLLLVAVGAVACWLPARRASRIDPMDALRSE